MGDFLNNLANSLASGVRQMQTYSGQAAARANGVSAAAQAAQGNFNQASANNANNIATDRIAEQYAFNSAQAAQANAFTSEMWEKAAAFNAAEAQKQRDWAERMESTKYQRAVKDMETAGLNPILAVTGGGVSVGSGGGSAASMSGASGQMASGGLMQGVSASEGNYTGQMEYMGGILGLLSAGLSGLSTAFSNFAYLDAFKDTFKDLLNFDNKDYTKGNYEEYSNAPNNATPGTYEYQYKQHWKRYWNSQSGKQD